MALEMSVAIMKPDWATGIMVGLPHMVTIRKTTLEKKSLQFLAKNGQIVDYSTVTRRQNG